MVLATLLARLKTDLDWRGGFPSGAAETRLKSAILSAAHLIYHEKNWRWKASSFTLTTTAGTKRYDKPGTLTDFSGWPEEGRIKYYLLDEVQTSYIIRDTTTKEYDLFYDHMAGQFVFNHDPGSGSLTVYYVPDFDIDIDNISTTITNIPNDFYIAFKLLVTSDLLDNPGNKKESQAYKSEGMVELSRIACNLRDKQRRVLQRTPRGLHGNAYTNIAEMAPQRPNVQTARWTNL